jgi:hypothetical protein
MMDIATGTVPTNPVRSSIYHTLSIIIIGEVGLAGHRVLEEDVGKGFCSTMILRNRTAERLDTGCMLA